MKIIILLFTVIILNTCLVTTVMAQHYQDDVVGSVIINIPIAITKTSDMNFGNIQVGSTAGTVVLAPGGGRTTTGVVTLPASTGTVQAASFTVTGNANTTYSITLPTTPLTITDPVSTKTMTVSNFTSNPTPTGILTGGSQTINVGAKLIVGASQTGGAYTNATGFAVTVNYN
jgi:hypothetical protein